MERIPKAGETILGGEFTTASGGKGANQAVAVARAGGESIFVARVGEDVFGDRAIAGLIREGIQVQHVVRDSTASSGVALILVDNDGENTIAVSSGANGRLSPADINSAKCAIFGASAVLMQLETPLEAVQAAAELAAEKGVTVILNPAPARDLPDELLKLVSILTPNAIEAELLTGIAVDDPNAAAQAALKLCDRGVETVIITLGARGAYVANASLNELVPGFLVDGVDSTAAGDVFNGALSVALAEGRHLLQAVQFANAAAAISVTRMGAQPSVPNRAEIERFMSEASNDNIYSPKLAIPSSDVGFKNGPPRQFPCAAEALNFTANQKLKLSE